MRNIICAVMLLSGTAHAVDSRDYGYGYWHHGYNSIEQQEEAQHNQYYLQQRMQIRVDEDLDNQLNQAQSTPLNDMYRSTIDTAGEE